MNKPDLVADKERMQVHRVESVRSDAEVQQHGRITLARQLVHAVVLLGELVEVSTRDVEAVVVRLLECSQHTIVDIQ